MDAFEIKPFVRVRNHIPKPGSACQALRQLGIDDLRVGQTTKRVGIRGWRVETEPNTCRHPQGRLRSASPAPEMQDHGVGSIGHRLKSVRTGRELLRDALEVTFDDGCLGSNQRSLEDHGNRSNTCS